MFVDRVFQECLTYDGEMVGCFNCVVYIIHLMSAREGNSFVFPRGSMFCNQVSDFKILKFA